MGGPGGSGRPPVRDPSEAQAHITTFWSMVAAGYEAHGGNVAEYGSAAYQGWVDALASVLPAPPSDVLDVASGTGYVALAAASLGHRVTAVDLAPAMLDELAAKATARNLAVDARLDDAVAPDFSPASFDVVTSRHLLWTLREPARAMASWRQLLRPGGRSWRWTASGSPTGTTATSRRPLLSTTQLIPGENFRLCTSTGPSRSSAPWLQPVSSTWLPSPGPISASAVACRTSSPPPGPEG